MTNVELTNLTSSLNTMKSSFDAMKSSFDTMHGTLESAVKAMMDLSKSINLSSELDRAESSMFAQKLNKMIDRIDYMQYGG